MKYRLAIKFFDLNDLISYLSFLASINWFGKHYVYVENLVVEIESEDEEELSKFEFIGCNKVFNGKKVQ